MGYGTLVLTSIAGIDTNSNIYESTNAKWNTDYEVNMNIGSWTDFFQAANYQQNSSNNDLVDVYLKVNKNYVIERLTNHHSFNLHQGQGSSASTLGTDDTNQTFGFRLLELAALSIFGHARARAAISDDNDYTELTLPGSGTTSTGTSYTNYPLKDILSNQIYDIFDHDVNTIFNQYVNYNHYQNVNLNNNDVDTPVNFNFANLRFQVKLFFNSNVTVSGTNNSLDVSSGITDSFSKTISLILQDSA